MHCHETNREEFGANNLLCINRRAVNKYCHTCHRFTLLIGREIVNDIIPTLRWVRQQVDNIYRIEVTKLMSKKSTTENKTAPR